MRLQHPARAQGKAIVAIVGGGFAGLNAAKALSGQQGVHVVLVDQRNYHLFQPLLYQVATAGLNAADIALPIRSQFRKSPNVEIHLARVERIDLDQSVLVGEGHELPFDYAILACGASHSYFGRDEWETFAPGLKTIEEATEIRRRLLTAFELAENELDPVRQTELLTFAVVGGGPTGVELAGAIAEISRTVLTNEFRRIDPSSARIVLIEAGPRVLAGFSDELSEVAADELAHLGVEVRTGTRVDQIDESGVTMGGTRLAAGAVFWAAGIVAAPFAFEPAVDRDRSGRVRVSPDLAVPGYKNVFVVGDLASVATPSGGAVPAVAPAAIQAGRHAARMILRDLQGHPREPFAYVDKGRMATIGRRRAVGETGRWRFTGRVAWYAWLLVHLLQLVTFQRRVAVASHWFWNYFLSKREARLITRSAWKLHT